MSASRSTPTACLRHTDSRLSLGNHFRLKSNTYMLLDPGQRFRQNSLTRHCRGDRLGVIRFLKLKKAKGNEKNGE
jgi:hypothetical protein